MKRKLEKGKYNDAYECAEDIRLVWKNCQTYNADGSDFYLLASTFSKRFEERFQKIVDDFGEDVVYASNAMPSSASGGGGGAAMASARHSSHPSSLGGRNARSNSTTGSSGRTTPVPNAVDNSAHPSSGSKSDNKGNNTHTNAGGSQSCSSLSGNSKEIITLDIRTRFAARLQRLSGMELGHVLQVLDMRCPDALDDPTEESLPSGAPRVTKQHNYSWETFDGGCQLEIDVDVIPPDVFYELDKYVKDKVQGRGRGAWSDEVWTESYNNNVGGAEGAGGGTRGSIKGKKRKHKSM